MRDIYGILSAKQIQRLDCIAIGKIGIPALSLMENAGRAVSEHAVKYLKNFQKKKAMIVCGTGNNGGDGFVTARYLNDAGIDAAVFVIGAKRDFKADAFIQYKVLKKLKMKVKEIKKADSVFRRQVRSADIIVDAIFGAGLNREIEEPYKSVINILNRSKRRIVSIDIPSGLDATTGKALGISVKAYATITFSCLKKGFLNPVAKQYTGKVVVVDIGIPKQAHRMLHEIR